MSEPQLREFHCQRHPDELIQRVYVKEVGKPLMCMSCLISREDNVDRKDVKTVKTFIDEIVANGQESSEFDINRQCYPLEIIPILDNEEANLAKLAEHIEKEKQKIEEVYEQVKERVLLVLQKKRVELTSQLDAQLHTFKQNYARLKNKVNKFFHGQNDNSFTSKEDLFTKMNSFNQTFELEGFVSSLLEELVENKIIVSSGKEFVEALKENISIAASQIQNQANLLPTSVLTNSAEFEKVASSLEKEMSKSLIQVNRIENPLLDIMIAGRVFDTEILKGNHKMIGTLKGWIVPEKSVKMNLLWRGSKDGWDWNKFTQKAGSSKPNLIIAKVKHNGALIGGYTDQDWQPVSNYKSSSFSFIFNLTEQKKYRVKKNMKANATYPMAGSGPTFGSGYDLYFASGMNNNSSSSSSLGNAYEGTQYQSICGQTNFQVEDFEFYECEHRKLTSEDEPRFVAGDEIVVQEEAEEEQPPIDLYNEADEGDAGMGLFE
mmetsp:Transcript_9917/g.11267  ORF Transcript_9917/g.11267 Transcript_9917/m.11267 type:complete len:490 (-) Transcript_9917:127-1596(-)